MQQGGIFGAHGAQADDLAVCERELFGRQGGRRGKDVRCGRIGRVLQVELGFRAGNAFSGNGQRQRQAVYFRQPTHSFGGVEQAVEPNAVVQSECLQGALRFGGQQRRQQGLAAGFVIQMNELPEHGIAF